MTIHNVNSPRSATLSIVITSYTMDRFKDICDLMDSIKGQRFDDTQYSKYSIETIFISERSEELYKNVKDYAFAIHLPTFRVLFSNEKLGLGGARNVGAKEAKGDIIAFVDDDTVLFPEWAEEMIKTYENDSIIGVSGAAIPLWQEKKLDWLPRIFYWLISCTEWTGWKEPIEARSLWGMNMSFRREAFEKAGSFLSDLGYHQPMAEDLEFSLRVKRKTGKKLLFNPKVKVWHKVYAFRVSLKFVASRAHHIGVSRRLLRATYFKEESHFQLERGVSIGIMRIFLLLPRDFMRSPNVAYKKFVITNTIVIFTTLGFVFPGRGLKLIKDVEAAFTND